MRRVVVVAGLFVACGGRSGSSPEPPWTPPAVDLGESAAASGTRLRALVWQSDSGPPLRTARFHDLERDEECSFAPDDEGTLRCFPTDAAGDYTVAPLFADAACSTHAYVPKSGATSPPRYVVTSHEAGCGSGTRVYELAETADELWSELRLFGCVGESGIAEAYRRGARIPNDAFVRGALGVVSKGAGRVAAQQLTADDGSAMLQSFFDLERNGTCQVESLAAGPRCVTSPVGIQGFWPGELTMDGVACWNVVVAWDPCTPPRTGMDIENDERKTRALIPAQDVHSPGAAVVDCLAVARANLSGTLWVFGDEISPDDFPVLAEREVPGSRLTGSSWQDETGLVVLPNDENDPTFFDTELGTNCALRVAADGAERCLPGWPNSRYADPECSQPLLYVGDQTPPAFVYTYSAADERYHVFETGDVYGGEVYNDYSDDGSDCRPITESATFYSTGAEVPAERFVRYDLVEVPPN